MTLFCFKVVSQREQVLVVPMEHLEDVRKNITESVNTENDVDDLAFTDVQFLTDDSKNIHVTDIKYGKIPCFPLILKYFRLEIERDFNKYIYIEIVYYSIALIISITLLNEP